MRENNGYLQCSGLKPCVIPHVGLYRVKGYIYIFIYIYIYIYIFVYTYIPCFAPCLITRGGAPRLPASSRTGEIPNKLTLPQPNPSISYIYINIHIYVYRVFIYICLAPLRRRAEHSCVGGFTRCLDGPGLPRTSLPTYLSISLVLSRGLTRGLTRAGFGLTHRRTEGVIQDVQLYGIRVNPRLTPRSLPCKVKG